MTGKEKQTEKTQERQSLYTLTPDHPPLAAIILIIIIIIIIILILIILQIILLSLLIFGPQGRVIGS